MPPKPYPARRPTSVEVARRAGVSQSAVSRCFTPGASIAPATRAKVLRAARELGYQPNLVARSLATRRSHLVAVLLPQVTNRYYPEVLLCLSDALERHDLRMLLFTFPNDAAVDAIFAEIIRYQVDGVIMAGRPDPDLLTQYRQRNVPIVLFNRYWPDIDVSSVSCDHRRSAAEVARRLYREGRRRFAVVVGRVDSPTNQERERGFSDELVRRGGDPPAVAHGLYDYATTAAAVIELLRAQPAIDALFCTNDVMAFACLDALRQKLKRCPGQDVAVVGFDDMSAADWGSYRLTTVRQPLERMAASTVTLLVDEINHQRQDAEHFSLPGKIIVRESARI